MIRSGRWIPLLLAGALSTGAGAPARAAEPTSPVPLRQNFSVLELGIAFAAAGGGVFLLLAGPEVLPAPVPGMGPPAPGSLDARISRWSYRPGKGRFLAGAPDLLGGYVLPVLPVLAYGLPLLALGGGEPWFAAGGHANHRLAAYVEAIGWTYLLTGAVKYAVGRPRPYTEGANDHPELRKRPGEDNLSFFSGHASSVFAVGAFVTEDVTRYLRRGPLAGWAPNPRLLVGSVLPHLVGYGVPALVGLSRVVDQQHWPSDVLLGALVGTLVAHLTYAAHFDGDGQPRRRHLGPDLRALPVVTADPSGTAIVQLAVVGRF